MCMCVCMTVCMCVHANVLHGDRGAERRRRAKN